MQFQSIPVTLAPTDTLQAAIPQIQAGGIGWAVVSQDHQWRGIVSQAQILSLAASLESGSTSGNWLSLTLAEVLTLAPLNIQPLAETLLTSLPLPALLNQLQASPINALPVVDLQGRVLGMVTYLHALAFASEQGLADRDRELEHLQAALGEIETNASQTADLFELQLQSQELNLSQYQDRLEGILNSIEDVVWSVVPGTFQLLYISAASERVLGRPIADFLARLDLWLDIIHPEDLPQFTQASPFLGNQNRLELEYRIIWPDQTVHWVSSRFFLVKDAEGKPQRIDGITTDITARRQMQEQLRYNALHDGLTGLANRNLLTDRILQASRRHQRKIDKSLAILFLDLDRFKVINDSLGHHIGDQLLINVAQRLSTCQRAGDTIARLGGDEFVLLLEDLDQPEDAIRVAQRIQSVLNIPIQLGEHEIVISTSIGIAFAHPNSSEASGVPISVTELLRDADTAMYRAKAQGPGQYAIFDISMHAEARRQLKTETDLRRALTAAEAGIGLELQVYYQPILALSTLKLVGFEALVRWQHPEWGLITPSEFIPIAEATGLILRLDQWVITTAHSQLQAWQRQFPEFANLTMNANLSGRHFDSPGLIAFFERLVAEENLQPESLKLEITETAVVSNPGAAAATMEQLQALGIQICLDDFGTGYASLSYLQALPFHVLKIDRSFTQQLNPNPTQPSKTAITRAIVNLGNTLGLGVVAEGIEAWEQLNHLQAWDCPHGQGYLFSYPLTREDTTTFLQNHQDQPI